MQRPHHAANVFKAFLTVLVALHLAVRVVAQPFVLTAPEPGLMAICSGTEIVYVSMETGMPVETDRDGTPAADPCPFLGVTAFDVSDNPELPRTSEFVLSLKRQMSGAPAFAARMIHQNTARGPPTNA